MRRRRLDQARRALLAPTGGTVVEIAARWQFAESSHFIRTFRRYCAQTPAQGGCVLAGGCSELG
ncbi:helix-turn-helix domain-containing protein [Actinoplanes awajinensis]|uniref:helix-turn-helix domain-containing protein n=1 Tax=Actinoplanes awajinensis TaxID=135946 RepID=UPI000A023EFF